MRENQWLCGLPILNTSASVCCLQLGCNVCRDCLWTRLYLLSVLILMVTVRILSGNRHVCSPTSHIPISFWFSYHYVAPSAWNTVGLFLYWWFPFQFVCSFFIGCVLAYMLFYSMRFCNILRYTPICKSAGGVWNAFGPFSPSGSLDSG